MALCSLFVMRGVLLENAQKMGNEVAHSYSVESERNMITYESMMRLSTRYIEQQLDDGREPGRWIQDFLEGIGDVLGAGVIDPYAVIGGEIVAANPWTGDADYELERAPWYQTAIEADGEIIFTDAYEDAITGRMVITIAQEIGDTGNIVAFDIFPENFRVEEQNGELPEGSYYFLCDSSGKLLYSESDLALDRDELQEYMDMLNEKIADGTFERSEGYIHNPMGEKRAAYYDIAQNGWISIVTMPYTTLLRGVWNASLIFAAFLLVFLLIVAALSIREYRLNKSYRRTNDTVRVLGNSYYAIYRMDFSGGTYEMIKGSDYVRSRIPVKGAYRQLVDTMGELMQPDVFEDFRTSFSIENIRGLVAKRTRDYGGDFQRRFGDSYRWVNVRLLFDESLNPNEAVLCFKEVDDEKREQLQQMQLLKESLRSARESEESKNLFFSNMSHDMRTPLNAIIGLSDLAKSHRDDAGKLREYMEKINYSSRQLLGLINDILEMSRLEKGKISLDNRKFSVKQCVTECAEVFRSQAEQEGKRFEISFELRDVSVYGDSFRLVQILNNLLSNAVKFTSKGDQICLLVQEAESGEYVKCRFIVRDTGAGMSEDFLGKLFIPYERETRFGARNVAGTGLGMPIVQNIVSQMNGQISVESSLGKGTAFTVTLPFELADGPQQQEEAKGQGAQDETEILENRRVLLAEDNEINMEISCELLTMCGAEVVQAWNGEEAVEQFAKSPEFSFDVILMDMQMPKLDGCGAARAIRRMDRRDAASVPIIAVTANAFAEDLAATSAAGMDAHISKPIDFGLLCRTVAELTRKKGS